MHLVMNYERNMYIYEQIQNPLMQFIHKLYTVYLKLHMQLVINCIQFVPNCITAYALLINCICLMQFVTNCIVLYAVYHKVHMQFKINCIQFMCKLHRLISDIFIFS